MDNAQQNRDKAAETAGFYDRFWLKVKAKPTYYEVFRINFIVDNIREFISGSKLKILDLGCGRGWMAPFLSPFGSVTGVDFSPVGIQIAKDNYGQYGDFILADPHSPHLGLPASASFDLVLCSEVIEHVIDQQALLKQITEFLTPEGWCVLTTPNGRVWPQYKSIVQSINRILRRKDGFQPIENWIIPEELIMLFQKLNFFVLRHEGQTLYRFGIPPLTLAGRLEAQLVDTFLRKLNLHHFYAQAILPIALYQIIIAQKQQFNTYFRID